MNLSSIGLIRIVFIFLYAAQLSSTIRPPSPLKLTFRPDEGDNSTSTREYLIPLDTPVDLSPRERYYFHRALGGIIHFDNPQNFWNAEITGWPSMAFKSICYVKYDSNEDLSRYSDEQLLGDHRLLRIFIESPQTRRSRMGEGTDDEPDGEEDEGARAIFCAAYYIRVNKLFEVYGSRLLGNEVI